MKFRTYAEYKADETRRYENELDRAQLTGHQIAERLAALRSLEEARIIYLNAEAAFHDAGSKFHALCPPCRLDNHGRPPESDGDFHKGHGCSSDFEINAALYEQRLEEEGRAKLTEEGGDRGCPFCGSPVTTVEKWGEARRHRNEFDRTRGALAKLRSMVGELFVVLGNPSLTEESRVANLLASIRRELGTSPGAGAHEPHSLLEGGDRT